MELPEPFAFSPQISRVGNYQLLRELAVGSSFHIDLAIAPGVAGASAVAIKRLRHDSQQGRKRLLREARVASGLLAPNLLRLVEAHGLTRVPPASAFVALEYVRGASLHKLLAYARPSDLRHAVAAILGALHGLDALHTWSDEQGTPGYLVHQAPTARHMLVGVDGVSRLIDLSHLQGRLLGETEDGLEGLVTAELAPEQVQGRELDPRCDVFIAGVTLRNVLARCAPLERGKFAALDEIWQRASAPRRSDRFWCAQEMGFALQRAAAALELTSTPAELGAWARARVAAAPRGDQPSGSRLIASRGDGALLTPPRSERAAHPLTLSRAALLRSGLSSAQVAQDDFSTCRPSRVDAPNLEPAPIRAPLPVGDRCSSVWYAMEPEADDDDVVRAIAAAKPLRRRMPTWTVLRSLASGAALGALVLVGFIAMGSSQQDEPIAQQSSFHLPVVHAAPPPAVAPAPAAQPAPFVAPVEQPALAPEAPPPEPKRKSRRSATRAPRFSLYNVPQNPF